MEINGRKSPSNRIRIWRKSKRIKQSALAKKVGCSASALSCWENDETFPPLHFAVKLAKKLGCNLEDLYPDLFEYDPSLEEDPDPEED